MEKGVKDQIADAMWNLCRKKDPGKVTVKDLVTECNVSRQIFYYYYQDIYDVVAYILERDLESAANESLKMDYGVEPAANFLGYIIERKDLIQRGLNSKLRAEIEHMLSQTIRKYVKVMMERAASDVAVKPSELEFLIDFASSGLFGKVLQVCDGEKIDVQEYCRQLVSLIYTKLGIE